MVELAGEYVKLDNLKTSDVRQLIEWSKNTRDSFFLLNSVLPVTGEDLVLELNAADHFLFIVQDNKNNKLGAVKAFNLNSVSKRGNIAFTMQPSNNNTKLMQDALEVVLARIFEKQAITKFYLHCLSHENELKLVLAKLLFKKEGHLREHYYWNNNYHDVEIFALNKEDYFR